jgi:hypothetical protein
MWHGSIWRAQQRAHSFSMLGTGLFKISKYLGKWHAALVDGNVSLDTSSITMKGEVNPAQLSQIVHQSVGSAVLAVLSAPTVICASGLIALAMCARAAQNVQVQLAG